MDMQRSTSIQISPALLRQQVQAELPVERQSALDLPEVTIELPAGSNHPRFRFDEGDEDQKIARLSKRLAEKGFMDGDSVSLLRLRQLAALKTWSFASHKSFSPEFKERIFTLLLCLERDRTALPKEMLSKLIETIAVAECQLSPAGANRLVEACLSTWFCGSMNAQEAAKLLQKKPTGSWVARFSSTKPLLTMSLKAPHKIIHLQVPSLSNEHSLEAQLAAIAGHYLNSDGSN